MKEGFRQQRHASIQLVKSTLGLTFVGETGCCEFVILTPVRVTVEGMHAF